MDSPGTRIRTVAAYALATLARLASIALAIPATLAFFQSTVRVVTGDFPIPQGTWAFDLIYVYVRAAQHVFDNLSPKYFSELDPTIQGLLVVVPNLVLVVLGLWSAISLAKAALSVDQNSG